MVWSLEELPRLESQHQWRESRKHHQQGDAGTETPASLSHDALARVIYKITRAVL